MSIWAHSKALASLTVITVNLLFWSIPVLVLGLVKWVVPGLRDRADASLEWVYRSAMRIDDAWLRSVMGLRWEEPLLELAMNENVIVLSNHVSWADILLIQSVVVRQGPILKFLTKRELMFVPIFGVIFWAFDFPILRRRTWGKEVESERRRRDLDSIKEACRILETRPAALVNFAEGTRFTGGKRDGQSSPYVHLLAPKVGGFSAILDALADNDFCVVDLTIKYPERHSFWEFLSGRVGRIGIDAVVMRAREIPRDREARGAWLAERFRIKDQRIEAFRRLEE